MESTTEALSRIATLLNRNLADPTPLTTTEQPKVATSEGVQPKTVNSTNRTKVQTSEGAINNEDKIAQPANTNNTHIENIIDSYQQQMQPPFTKCSIKLPLKGTVMKSNNRIVHPLQLPRMNASRNIVNYIPQSDILCSCAATNTHFIAVAIKPPQQTT